MSFPWLSEEEHIFFPPVEESTEEGIVAVGGNLSPGVLLSAYRQGIFPWYSEGQDILWWSPDPRFVLFTENLKISKSMKKEIRKKKYEVVLDRNFQKVIGACRDSVRKGQRGTWITEDMFRAYCAIHEMGWAHSVEVLDKGNLVAGLYGVSIGRVFFGESMFTRVPNGSKTALILLTLFLKDRGFKIIDSQDHTDHLESLGAENIRREDFYGILKKELSFPDYRGMWNRIFPEFPDSEGLRDILK
ncbi:leucyl/phenylalanyl-tRNA--protein transferase [Spirochaeta isovalerica]|uniref:Leucyl/phenylalanyl-tRNA--protein transferase n=1 Tax=Spirochaeta isovalerica TaxID=150 RepID=A0A841RAT6_9SPIO|nr:leucyl/phenylalanyl-tRNA--protein transferase [Spirochaeta isovalerica]MBB6480826.1 leucyl/phenylalanyl-tRNA--protein transferase [Spirochaeta isovalerica]